ncbi:MAG: hypothetical protein Kow0031_37770 [Anaerolineae bacterium]
MPQHPQTIGPYQIIEELGRGGFATVYRARDKMSREVALKVIRNHHAGDDDFIERFRQEAQTAAGLRHPRLIHIYDFDEFDGQLYLAMELIPGPSLRRLLTDHGPLPLEEALPLLRQLAEALDYLHGRRLVHRDVKPANVLLEGDHPRRQVTLADFGLVRSMEHSTRFTQSGSSLGTPAYCAPEQADRDKWGDISPLTDVYALGVLTFELLLGRLPFEGDGLALLRAHADDEPVIPLEQATELGDDLVQFLRQALAKPPAERFQSAGALAGALQTLAEQRQTTRQRRAELDELLAQAQTAKAAENWSLVAQLCSQITQLDPAHPDAVKMLVEAAAGIQQSSAKETARRERQRRYQAGVTAFDEARWAEAIAALEPVVTADPDFKDAAERLAAARAEQQRAEAYSEAIAHAEAEQWTEACRLWLQVLNGNLNYQNGDAARRLLTAVEQLLDELGAVRRHFKQQQQQLAQSQRALALYEQLAAAVTTPNWPAAHTAGTDLLALHRDLPQAERWLAQATAELARLEQRAAATGDTMTWDKDGKKMVRVPAGEFLYGDNNEKKTLLEFWIDQTPVTNAEFARFVEATGHKTTAEEKGSGYAYVGSNWNEVKGADWRHPGGPKTDIAAKMDHPVVQVSWHDAQAYAEWAGKELPTEEQWEKAARGAEGRKHPWGDDAPTKELCNFNKNVGDTTSVGHYSPQGDSSFGAVDMAGNVWEWTSSDYDISRKVLRGGAWDDDESNVRSANRINNVPDLRLDLVGFRCVVPPGK